VKKSLKINTISRRFVRPHDLGHRAVGRDGAQHFLVEGGQRDLVALVHDGVAQGGDHLRGVCQLLLRAVAVTHRSAGIQHAMADEVRLHFVLLDEQQVAREVEPPVDMLGIVAPDILAVAGKLDGEARHRRLMRPGQVAQHQPAGINPPPGQPVEYVRVEIARKYGTCHARASIGGI
jgi:hypothetical protein